MATKKELVEAIAAAGGDELNKDSFTVEELEAKLAEIQAPAEEQVNPLDALKAPGGLTRRKVNRGSTRRIARAHSAFQAALTAFADELDLQVYITNEDGKRTGEAELVKGLRALGPEISEQIAAITTPPLTEPAE
jgi:hypothetical protein